MPDVAAVKKKIKKNRKSSSVTVNDLKKKVARDEAGNTTSKVASTRYIATPTSLDSWYKYSVISQPHPQQAAVPLHQAVPTPTPTQSTYVSENSSQRTTDHEEEEESSSTTNGSHQYEFPEHHNVHSYTRHPHHHHHKNNNHRNHHHVYSTIPDSTPLTYPHSRSSTSSGDPTENYPANMCKHANSMVANGRTYFV
jgi:hypothetical protein